ncbi:MAG: NAD(P)-binding domain-containing protein [Defluviitaleaceae bacterium]|nr:NAD(P)-binding domain-containing protein [Defluviitaleaceae bacterium]
MKIGFIGVGTIATCIIEGFCGFGEEHYFFLSPRNAAKSAELAAKYGNITVCESNQNVVDESDVVFIAMLSPNCPEILRGLDFRSDQQIVNVVANIPPEDIRDAIGDVGGFSHVIPLPAIQHREGPIAAYPESMFLRELLSPLGTLVFADILDDIRTMQSITALIAAFYDTLHNLTIYAETQGLARDKAASFMSAFFSSLCKNFEKTSYEELAAEMTLGGLNMMALDLLKKNNVTKAWADVMMPVMERIKKA